MGVWFTIYILVGVFGVCFNGSMRAKNALLSMLSLKQIPAMYRGRPNLSNGKESNNSRCSASHQMSAKENFLESE